MAVAASIRAHRIRVKDGGDMDNQDASRPFFQRKPGEVGLYLMVYDATAVNPKEFGSEHFFIMDLMDKLFDQFVKTDAVIIRNAFEKKGHFKGTYIERFEKGIVLALGFDDSDALERIWKLHNNGKLTPLLQEVLITLAMLKSAGATKIVLSTRMFEDEYSNCKNELICRKMERLSIKTKASDMAILERLKTFRDTLNEEVQNMREIEYNFNTNLGEFIMTIKQVLPANLSSLKTLKEFETNMKMAKGLQGKKMQHIDKYLDIVKDWRLRMAKIDEKVCQPLLQIHTICETEKQQEQKLKMRACCKDIQDQLRSEANLQTIRHDGWTKKLLKKEQALFGGLISLVPLGADAAFDINCMLDEYISDFPL